MTPKFQDNSYWMLSFREGKPEAFRRVFNEHHRALCFYAIKMGLEKEEAEDIAADSFTKLWHGRMQITSEEHIKGFLITATRNAALNLLKQKKRRAASNNELSYLLADKEEDFFRKMVEIELLQKLHPHIENLPKKCKAVFKQIYFDGASTEEVAANLGISARNVLNQKARALQLLRDKILLIILINTLLGLCLSGAQAATGTPPAGLMQPAGKKSKKSFCQRVTTRCLYNRTREGTGSKTQLLPYFLWKKSNT